MNPSPLERLFGAGAPALGQKTFSWFLAYLGWVIVLGLLPRCLAADQGRGIWWWTSPNHPWGTGQVIGVPVKETAALEFLKAAGISRLYCSFSEQAQARPATVRAWNERVHAARMSSQLLLSENTWVQPASRANLTTVHLQHELIEFNAGCTHASQRFDGLHLDIEPHGLPDWKTMTPSERKNLLLLLRDTFQEVRSYLDAHGAKDLPVYADLPVWFDQPGNPVGWPSPEERDKWFADLARSLAGISLMAYERNTVARIESGVAWEVQNFPGEVRVGLEVSVGSEPGKTWKTSQDLMTMFQLQEAAKPARAVDIHDFIQFHDLVAGPNEPGSASKDAAGK